MTLAAGDVRQAAAALFAAQNDRLPIGPLSERYPGLDVADAYAIQQVNLSRRLSDRRKVVGHKIGLTSEPMQTLLGVHEPDFGYILENGRVVLDGEAAALRDNEDVREFYLGVAGAERRSFKDVKSYRRRKRWLA